MKMEISLKKLLGALGVGTVTGIYAYNNLNIPLLDNPIVSGLVVLVATVVAILTLSKD